MGVSFKPAMVVITQGDPKSLVSRMIQWATGSWWTHGFVVLSETEGVEAKMPRVSVLNIQDRLMELEQGGRDYIVMDLPGITDAQREAVVQAALSFNHRLYDIWNCLFFVIFKIWWEGGKRLVCSRLMSAAYYDGIQKNVFDEVTTKLPLTLRYRATNLQDGYCTPDEFFRYSDLEVIFRSKV